MKRVVATLLCAAAALLGGAASGAPHHAAPHHGAHKKTAAAPGKSLSLGAPNEGHLEGGARLDEHSYLRFVPGHEHRWGLPQLVGLLDRGAARVNRRFTGSVMAVGDLSRRGGGDVAGHHSHESGRDADVGFYAVNSAGKPLVLDRFVAFDEEGRAGKIRFDDARNWALIESWLNDPQAHVSHIFVAAHLRDRLLAYARQHNVASGLRNRAAMALMQPKHGLPHDNHFHVRIACPSSQRGSCVEYVIREHPRGHGHDKHKLSKHASRPVIARARKRVGTTGKAAPAMVAVVPAPHDVD